MNKLSPPQTEALNPILEGAAKDLMTRSGALGAAIITIHAEKDPARGRLVDVTTSVMAVDASPAMACEMALELIAMAGDDLLKRGCLCDNCREIAGRISGAMAALQPALGPFSQEAGGLH